MEMIKFTDGTKLFRAEKQWSVEQNCKTPLLGNVTEH